MLKQWKLKTTDADALTVLSDNGTIHPVVAKILVTRGIATKDDAAGFLSPSFSAMLDPYLMLGMEEAVTRLLTARRNKEKVCIYGDYDVDGITGTALLVSFFRTVGMECGYFIPNRFDDGYGLNIEAIEHINSSGASLIVSVDCGITAVDEALFCRKLAMDLIIVDHHSPRETVPDACAVLNPLLPGCQYPFKFLAGVGVAFNLLVALRSALRNEGAFAEQSEPDLRQWLDLVALGTIADVVPLTGQNRIYAFHGLRQLTSSVKPGIQALKNVAGVTGPVNCGQVAFRLGPRLNAAGRMESAVPGVDLLLSENHGEPKCIADDLDAANSERQAIERRILDEAVAMLESSGNFPHCRSIVLAADSWHQGVVGIVASRLVERYHRPTILMAIGEDGIVKGSGRSIPGFHLLEALTPCAAHLERFGGHRYAVGVSLSVDKLAFFSASFEDEARRLLSEDDLIPRLDIDVEVQPEDISIELAQELQLMEPFGAGNPEPVLLMKNMTVVERRTVGDGHLRLRLTRDGIQFNAIAFRMATCDTSGPVDLAFFPEMNLWNGSSKLQLRVKDLRPAE